MNNDRLTGLHDRPSFMTLINRQCEQSINTGSTLAVVLLDINCFRKVNVAFGYRAGDEVLNVVGRLLGEAGRKRDLMSRIGDDQFAMILPGVMNVGHAVLAASKLLRLLEAPIVVRDQQIRLSATVGIAVCPQHGRNGDVLLAQAEEAIRIARDDGVPYAVAQRERLSRTSEDFDLEFGLQTAVSAGELELYYQPKLHIRDKVPVGAEALMRWNSSMRGDVPATEFIPAAEKSGAIIGMTQWAINTALRQSQEWPARWGTLGVAVNLSARVLNDPTLVELLTGSLGIWEAEARSLTLEVTESSAMASPDVSFELFRAIRQLGAHVSLDDFGTGYSSLAYFRDIPADELKLDQSFVTDMVRNQSNLHIARLVIDLAHSFDMTVVAEGVENAATYRLLAKLGCDHAQGYFVARPMRQEQYVQWLEQYRGLSENGAVLRGRAKRRDTG